MKTKATNLSRKSRELVRMKNERRWALFGIINGKNQSVRRIFFSNLIKTWRSSFQNFFSDLVSSKAHPDDSAQEAKVDRQLGACAAIGTQSRSRQAGSAMRCGRRHRTSYRCGRHTLLALATMQLAMWVASFPLLLSCQKTSIGLLQTILTSFIY